MIYEPIPYRRCTVCAQHFPATREYFYKQHNNNIGLHSQCKDCSRKRAANYRERFPEYEKSYRDNNHQKEYERQKRWTSKNRDKANARVKRYYKTENGKVKHKKTAAAYNQRKASAEGVFTAEDFQEQLLKQNGKCFYCHKALEDGDRKIHTDHVIPLTRGGTNNPDNIVIACQSCNSSKGNKLVEEWIKH